VDDIDVVVIGAGQSRLAAARALLTTGMQPVVVEAGERPVGSWPRYYDSLTLFSPARYSALPGMPFPGDPDRYPRRDEVIDYLARYAASMDVEIRTGRRVERVDADGSGFLVRLADGAELHARRWWRPPAGSAGRTDRLCPAWTASPVR
jgi:putative flavoprotein involved in K+ transport